MTNFSCKTSSVKFSALTDYYPERFESLAHFMILYFGTAIFLSLEQLPQGHLGNNGSVLTANSIIYFIMIFKPISLVSSPMISFCLLCFTLEKCSVRTTRLCIKDFFLRFCVRIFPLVTRSSLADELILLIVWTSNTA